MSWGKKKAGRHSWRRWGIVRRQRAADKHAADEAAAADQEWFWTDRWQKMEREVDEHIARGEVETFDDAESFLAGISDSTAERCAALNDAAARIARGELDVVSPEELKALRAEAQRKLAELQDDDPMSEEEIVEAIRRNRQSGGSGGAADDE